MPTFSMIDLPPFWNYHENNDSCLSGNFLEGFFHLIESLFLFVSLHESFLHVVRYLLGQGRRVLACYASRAEFVLFESYRAHKTSERLVANGVCSYCFCN